jgi:hypothetical protein
MKISIYVQEYHISLKLPYVHGTNITYDPLLEKLNLNKKCRTTHMPPFLALYSYH